MNILLVYPEYPDTFWSFKHSLRFIAKKAAFPPLGLLTVAAMLPDDWSKKVVDLNVEPLTDSHLGWADMVFLSAMIVQKETALQVIARCKRKGKKLLPAALFDAGWRKSVFIVDDNFIGNTGKVKQLLPTLIEWQRQHKFPFALLTEVSTNLARDEESMQLMSAANFFKVFLGLKTPNQDSLLESGKKQIGVVTAMVGILTALPQTRLWHRLKAEGRLLKDARGENTDGRLNFSPIMDKEKRIEGYRKPVFVIGN